MKKLTTLFILVFLSVGLFAEPKIPKHTDAETAEKGYYYINDSLTNEYKIYSLINNDYSLYTFEFSNISLINNIRINIIIRFKDEKSLDKFTSTIDLYNIDTEFSKLRKRLDNANVSPTVLLDKTTNKVKELFYQAKYEEITK